MGMELTARKIPQLATPPYRAAPHNIEAEQALLGAILVNNEALYRVSDFLDPTHFSSLSIGTSTTSPAHSFEPENLLRRSR